MSHVDYHKVITKFIPIYSKLYGLYITHVTLVTQKAIKIAKRLKLTGTQIRFIEEASMLHDIGIIKVYAPKLYCFGDAPYIQHTIIGAKLLSEIGLPKHAQVALRHGLGLSKEYIKTRNLPLPPMDISPVTIEEEIISYADLFFSKNPKHLWHERTFDEVIHYLEELQLYGFITKAKQWYIRFGE